jgi:CRP-like cAMP-binding protein
MAKAVAKSKKSGIKTFKPGELLFNQGDTADSLYIIQRGQIRLYIPKGRGFVELAILRSGEVIGEMAYFDENATRRSCSATSIVTTEVIEISFKAFEKTMSGLNPWFKTIINTLANRLRKTNDKVKELESNSVGYGSGGKVGDYKFLVSQDIIRVLSVFYLVMKSHGVVVEGKSEIHLTKLKFYITDVFNVPEIKFEEFYNLLESEGFITLGADPDGLMKMIQIADLESFRAMMLFFNSQRIAEESKKIKISPKCERFLQKILQQMNTKGATEEFVSCDISAILNEFKEQNIPIMDEDLRDAINANICDDILIGDMNKLTSKVNVPKLKMLYPSIKMMNCIQKLNDSKAGQA